MGQSNKGGLRFPPPNPVTMLGSFPPQLPLLNSSQTEVSTEIYSTCRSSQLRDGWKPSNVPLQEAILCKQLSSIVCSQFSIL